MIRVAMTTMMMADPTVIPIAIPMEVSKAPPKIPLADPRFPPPLALELFILMFPLL